MRRDTSRRLEALERKLKTTHECFSCGDTCPRAEGCLYWYLRSILDQLECERRTGNSLKHADAAIQLRVTAKARPVEVEEATLARLTAGTEPRLLV